MKVKDLDANQFARLSALLDEALALAAEQRDGRRPPGEATLGNLIDSRYGRGTYLSILKQLKLELLFACMAFAIGIVGLLRSLDLGGLSGAFIISGIFLSAGVAFLVTPFVMRRRWLK